MAKGFITLSLTLISVVNCDWIDLDTPKSVQSINSLVTGEKLDLVFSDEFEVSGRSFDDGHDPRWTALNKNDYTNDALHFYDKDHVTTNHGCMNITTTAEYSEFEAIDIKTHKLKKKKKNFKSGMVQGWNKFCFTGGVLEIRAQLPGPAYIGGLWPAIWIMGNLARATYVGSSDWVWPWSFNTCDRSIQKKQLISSCNPYPHFDMHSLEGRGAPEIDLLEAMPGQAQMLPSNIEKPYFSTSLQIAPGIEASNRPQKGGFPMTGSWYEGMEYGPNTSMNVYFYGSRTAKPNPEYSYQADALSGNTQLNQNLWENFRTYRIEWKLPTPIDDDKSSAGEDSSNNMYNDGYVKWFFDNKMVYGISGKTLSKKLGAIIPSEPSYVIMNTAMSATWGFPEGETGCPKNCDCSCYDCLDASGKCSCGFAPGFCNSLPSHFLIDYVRVYQNADEASEKVGCSTPERPTSKWIKGHLDSYKQDTDKLPLLPLQVGGATCHHHSDCGGGNKHRGQCLLKKCECYDGFVGPTCKSYETSDPILWEKEEALGFVPPVLPSSLISSFIILFMISLVTYVTYVRKLQSVQAISSDKPIVLDNPRLNFKLEPDPIGTPKRPSRIPSTEALSSQVERKPYSLVRGPSEVMLSRMMDR